MPRFRKKHALCCLFAAVLFPVWLAPARSDDDPKILLNQISSFKQNPPDAEAKTLAGLLEKSLAAYDALNGYEAVFHKQETADNKLGPAETIYLKFEKPFKIFMGWQDTEKKGLQVVYERGRHHGKLAIHKPGLFFGLAPVLFLDQQSPWVREGSPSYNIEDAGIGNFLLEFTKAVLASAGQKNLEVVLADDGRKVTVTFLNSAPDSAFFAYRVVVFFDPVSSLPTRMTLFDWRDQPMGIYAYEDLQINPDPDRKEFLEQIDRALYRVYRGT
jgi:hypothetical protein